MQMDIRAIRTEADYAWAVDEIARYFDDQPTPGTPEAARFDVLADLLKVYEDRHHPIEAPDPVEMIKQWMELRQLTQRDLAALIGSKSRASEILNRKRALTMEMVFKLNREWHIPADILVAPYHLAA
ncbi:HTH-type transcriptional regulator/antitoxin HigA [Bosea sp. 62]|nr:HTH-type transcriptional regulator/antitoxin HigA [Bosea sp. 46]CAD5248207.1 HTH-type transcriptional regulator/antitoxin HigA [Bosea sp. 21B]CAD5267754.1 HTH-type transcriptional regulator/antitoxin HigA [Bosea sp. 7B]VVT45542.1 XRE family transcriptional regulator [Bosea sp. EC-HK365B]VXA93886.1 HTH-type transcriptional regulator/antitoxin HigA [Bosea sp. 29B]VXA94118.1 HTH-type transcriptional regulator/antitoxin HigA [Bosea sp. 125]VXB95453.1 HTH-type transcriptional regulator/antitoxi